MTRPGVPSSPGFPLLDPAAQSAIRAAQDRMDVLTRPRFPLPAREHLTGEEKDSALAEAAQTACAYCGGIHPAAGTAACRRLASFKVNGDGTITEGAFWRDGEWDDSAVVWPADLAEKDDGAPAHGIEVPDAMTAPGFTHSIPALEQWAQVFPGLQCRVEMYTPGGQPQIQFRLTPQGEDDDG